MSFLNPLSNTFSIPSRYLFFFSGYFDSTIRGTTFLPIFSHFASHISYPFDFISWCNLLVEFYGKGRPVDVIFRQAQSQSSRYLICIILCQTHFLQVSLVHNITSHTLKGLSSYYIEEDPLCWVLFYWTISWLIAIIYIINVIRYFFRKKFDRNMFLQLCGQFLKISLLVN